MRCLILGVSLGVLLGASGCGGGDSSTSASGSPDGPDLAGVELQGSATRDELSAVLSAVPVTKGELPEFTSPKQSTIFTKTDPIPTFRWSLEDEKGHEQTTELTTGSIEGTYLQFGALGQPEIVRVFTSEGSFTPTAEQWKDVSIGTWVTVAILSAHFDKGKLEGSVGQGEPLAFCSAMTGVWQP